MKKQFLATLVAALGLIFLLPAVSFAAIANVGHVSAGATGANNTATTASLNTTGATLLVVSASGYNASMAFAGIITDSQGNTWHALTNHGGSTSENAIWYAYDKSGSALSTGSDTVSLSVSVGNSGQFPAVVFSAWSGTKTDSTVFDKQGGANTASGTTIQPGSLTPTNNGSLVITSLATDAAGTATISGGSFAVLDQQTYLASNNLGSAMGYVIQGTSGAVNPTWTAGSGPMGSAMAVFNAAPSYSYERSVTIDHTKVGTVNNTDQSSFPVVVDGTYSYLATVANGGLVQNSSGYDVGFFSDAACTRKLEWETESYSAANGTVVYWVNIPTVSHSTNTVFYLCYDGSSITTDQSNPTAVWDSNFVGVWHMNAASGNQLDSTSNGGTASPISGNGTITYQQPGIIGKAIQFGGSDGFTISPFTALNLQSSSITFYAIVNATTTSAGKRLLTWVGGSNMQYAQGSGANPFSMRGTNSTSISAANVSFNTWTQIAITNDNVHVIPYKNGVAGTSIAQAYPGGANSTAVYIGEQAAVGTQVWPGMVNELEISKIVRSADWIVTEYNNQFSTTTFYTIGGQVATAGVTYNAAGAKDQFWGGFFKIVGGFFRIR